MYFFLYHVKVFLQSITGIAFLGLLHSSSVFSQIANLFLEPSFPWWSLCLILYVIRLFSVHLPGPTNRWIFMFLPWGSPQVGDHPPLLAAWGSSSCAEASCSLDSENSSSKSLASAPNSESMSTTRISLIAGSSSFILFAAITKCTAQWRTQTVLYDCCHCWRNGMPQR